MSLFIKLVLFLFVSLILVLPVSKALAQEVNTQAAPNSYPILFDGFNRANNSYLLTAETGQTWTSSVSGGIWGISNNQAYMSAGCPQGGYSAVDSFATVNTGNANGVLKVKLALASANMKIPFRYSNSLNYDVLETANNSFILRKVVGGVAQGTSPYTNIVAVNGDIIEIYMAGPQIAVFRNGTQILIRNDDTQNANFTNHGIGGRCDSAIRFEDFGFGTLGDFGTFNLTQAQSTSCVAGKATIDINFDRVNGKNYVVMSEPNLFPNGQTPSTLGTNPNSFRLSQTANLATTYKITVKEIGGTQSRQASVTTLASCPALQIPVAPTNVVATPQACSGTTSPVKITWNQVDDANRPVGSFLIERTTNGTVWTSVGTPAAALREFTDNSGASSASYAYRVSAIGTASNPGSSSATNSLWVVTNNCSSLIPTPPTNVVATPQACLGSISPIKITWNQATDPNRPVYFFIVERTTNGTNWSAIGWPAAADREFTDNSAASNTWYAYRISTAGTSANPGASSPTNSNWTVSNNCSAGQIPSAPTNVSANPLACDGTTSNPVKITWSQADEPTRPVDSFKIERTLEGNNWTLAGTVGSSLREFTDISSSANTWYAYRVSAIGTASNPGSSSAINSNWTVTGNCLAP